MHLIPLFREINPHKRYLQAKDKNWNEPKTGNAKRHDLGRSIEIKLIWKFDPKFPTISLKSCTYITFIFVVKRRPLSYGYPRGQIYPPSNYIILPGKNIYMYPLIYMLSI